MQYFKVLPVLILEMQMRLCQEKSDPFPGSKDLILNPALQLRLLQRDVSLACKLLLSARLQSEFSRQLFLWRCKCIISHMHSVDQD